MRKFIRPLPAHVEFGAVVGVAFGYPIFISLLRGFGLQHQQTLTAHNLMLLSSFEVGVGAFLIFFLWLQGWTIEKIGLSPTVKDAGVGLLLFVVTTIVWIAVYWGTYFISPQTVAHMREVYTQLKVPAVPATIVVSTSLINAAFEEVFVSGYVITALRSSRGPTFAINVSAVIRLLYHLYQGQMAVLGILPLGLIYAYWYARTGRLWPLIVAHAVQDVITLML